MDDTVINTNIYRDYFLICWYKVKGKGAHEPKAQTPGAYHGFLNMKHA